MAASDDKPLQFIEHLHHRDYQLKTARRGDMLMVLIYPPNAALATRRVVDTVENYEKAVHAARMSIDRAVLERLLPLANPEEARKRDIVGDNANRGDHRGSEAIRDHIRSGNKIAPAADLGINGRYIQDPRELWPQGIDRRNKSAATWHRAGAR